jgi:hypothetical protein
MCLQMIFTLLVYLAITRWRVKAEDREEWSKIVEQAKTHPAL